jgi:hypothetical protein
MPELIVPTDMRSELLGALRGEQHHWEADIWECRTCGSTTRYVTVIPAPGAWGHAVEPLCRSHYPDGRHRLCTVNWPGPATPTLGARRRAERDLAWAQLLAADFAHTLRSGVQWTERDDDDQAYWIRKAQRLLANAEREGLLR